MRKELAKKEGERKKFEATVSRLGRKTNYLGHREDTILLVNIIDSETNQTVTGHLWFSFTKGFESANVKPGDRIEFEARVRKYSKGYVNRRYEVNKKQTDYRLSHPTKIHVKKN